MHSRMDFHSKFFIIFKRIISERLFLLLMLILPISACILKLCEDKKLAFNEESSITYVYPEDYEEKLRQMAESESIKPIVKAYVTKDSILNLLALQNESTKVFKDFSKVYFEEYCKNNLGECFDEKTAEEYLLDNAMEGELFSVQYASGEPANMNMFSSYVRGFVALLINLSGLFGACLFYADKGKGVFQKGPSKEKLFLLFYIASMQLLWSFVGLFTLVLIGESKGICLEIGAILLYNLDSLIMNYLLSLALCSVNLLGAFIPISFLIQMIFCPIIVNVMGLEKIRFFLPIIKYLRRF